MLARLLIALLTLAALLGPSAASADPLAGVWGGDQARLTLTASGGALELGCGHGRLDGPIQPDSDGHFRVTGALEIYGVGPQPAGRGPQSKAVSFSGELHGQTLRLTVRSAAGEETYGLVQGARPKIVRCL